MSYVLSAHDCLGFVHIFDDLKHFIEANHSKNFQEAIAEAAKDEIAFQLSGFAPATHQTAQATTVDVANLVEINDKFGTAVFFQQACQFSFELRRLCLIQPPIKGNKRYIVG